MLITAGRDNGKPLDYGELERWTRVNGQFVVPAGGQVKVPTLRVFDQLVVDVGSSFRCGLVSCGSCRRR